MAIEKESERQIFMREVSNILAKFAHIALVNPESELYSNEGVDVLVYGDIFMSISLRRVVDDESLPFSCDKVENSPSIMLHLSKG